MRDHQAPFDARALRDALGAFVTGVTVVTTQDQEGKPHGLTANSFNTVSLEPPLILWSQARQAGSYAVFQRAGEFAISILAEDQFELSSRFATRRADKFDGVDVDRAFCGLPVIAGSSAWLHCRTVSQVDGGDHTIYVGEILKIARGSRRPLVFGGGQYLLAQPHHAALPSATAVPTGARQRHALRLCTPSMQQIAEETGVTICGGVWGNCGPTIVAWEGGPGSVLPAFPLGLVLPVTRSASGKAFAADLPSDVVAPFVERELQDAKDSGAAGPPRDWSATLAQVRATRLAQHPPTRFWNHDLLITASSVAVRDHDGQAIVTMTAVVESTLPDGVLAEATRRMQAAALKIERQLGFSAAPQPVTENIA
jgi:flavin reductase (DIM6/NTAB) family NADH-FMN oxidoreductase RutF/DNA-binding IclR family transcriptional regulator